MPESASIISQKNIDLTPYNTLGVKATARRFISVSSGDQLQSLLQGSEMNDLPLFILGGGSNVLFTGNYRGCVLRMEIKGREVVKEDRNRVWLRIGAGENWHKTVLHCVHKGWGGIENLSLIPGTVGAAPIQNIGAYGVELEEVFEKLEAIEMATGEKRIFTKSECGFGYRDSVFKNKLKGKYAVTRVTLQLSRQPEVNTSYGAIRSQLEAKGISDPSIKDISDIVIGIRNSKLPDPSDLGNAGSFFKNPVLPANTFETLKRKYPDMPGYSLNEGKIKVPAGWLIEQTGWKGKVVGNTGTYKQQALVIVNHGGASGKEILDLAEKIRASVAGRFGIELVPEVNIIGDRGEGERG